MNNVNYISINRLFSTMSSYIEKELIDEDGIVAYAGRALDIMRVNNTYVPMVSFQKIENYVCAMPPYTLLKEVWVDCGTKYEKDPYEEEDQDCHSCGKKEVSCGCGERVIEKHTKIIKGVNPCDIDFETTINSYVIPCSAHLWRESNCCGSFTPAVLEQGNSFFSSDNICEDTDKELLCLYPKCPNRYTVIGTTNKRLRFNFKEGRSAIAYLSVPKDKDGYPLIPDDPYCIEAIEYFIRWKISEELSMDGREGYLNMSDRFEQKWNIYKRTAMGNFKLKEAFEKTN